MKPDGGKSAIVFRPRRCPLILVLGVAARRGVQRRCSSEARTSPSPPGSSSAKPRIALVMKSLANEFFATMAEGAKQHQEQHAGEYELIINGIKDERDLSRQVALGR